MTYGISRANLVELWKVVMSLESNKRKRQTIVPPVEIYTPQLRAEFLLSNAVDAKDYARAAEEVRKMGFDPAKIPHRKPTGAK